jgi:tRNA A37 threonylcarbamoyladenosine synthetase subunit TsaC/SUA5/YrdC
VSGSPSCASGAEVFTQLGDRLPLILDAGETNDSVPSTIVELRGDHWCIGREGAVPTGQILAALGGDEAAPA